MNLRRMTAAVLGASLALAAANCEPAAQVPEGAWGYDPVPPVVGMTAVEFVVTARVVEDETYDPTLRFFTLQMGDRQGAVTVMGAKTLPLVQWLHARNGQRIPITFGEGR